MSRLVKLVCLLVAMVPVLAVHGAAPILLKTGTILPEEESSLLSTQVKVPSQQLQKVSDQGLYIIQHDGVITPDWREKIEKAGAIIRGYIPENAYLIEASKESYSTIISSVEHSYLGDYAPEYRYEAAELVAAPQTKSTAAEDEVLTSSGESVEAVSDYDILLFDADKRSEVSTRVAKLHACSVVSSDGKVIRAKLTVAAIREIASWVEIEYIEPYHELTLHNNVAVQAPRMNIETVWPDGSTGLGLTGEGQVVAVADTGLDTGNKSTLHEDVKGRVLRCHSIGRIDSGDWSDPDGHGTHVVGSVLGNGTKSGGSIKGGAYKASLILQSLINEKGKLSNYADLNNLFQEAYDDEAGTSGARIHSNSYGSSQYGAYTQRSRNVDEFMFSHPDMLILFSAGNDGIDSDGDGVIDFDSIGVPASAKNCVTVGASENYRTTGNYHGITWGRAWPEDFPATPISDDDWVRPYDGTHQGIVAFSSRGPCDDGRIKPDIVAPGSGILSLLSSLSKKPSTSSAYYYNDYYRYMQGTSQACPLVAGSAALVRQWLVEKEGIANPDGATVKAVLLAGAKSLTPGQYGTDSYREIPASYPNNVEGWGQVDLGNSVQNAKGLLVYNAQVIEHGETQTFTVRATAGSQLNIVMAYTDAPASLSAAKQLVNDLDLLVTSPSGTAYYPNSRTSADRVNNVEGVRIPSGSVESGTYTITVKAYNIAQGMSSSFTGGKSNAQRYSLVVNGADKITSYMVTFNANGGTVSPTSRTVSGGSAVGDLPSPTRSNYTFDGWFTASSGGTRVYSTTVVSGNVTYYAHWTPVVTYCTVTFNANGGAVSPSTRSVASGTAVGDLPTPTRSNHTFDGWYTAASGGTQITASTVVSASVTYYAHWTEIPDNYTVTFNPNGGTVSPTSRIVADGSAVGTLPVPTRSGYMFAGWWTSSTGGAKVDSGTIVTGNVTFYAHWTTSPFAFGGDAQWSLQGDGSYRSGSIDDNGTSWMEATVTGAGTVSFKWRVSSEVWDKLEFTIDGVTKATIRGTNTLAWTEKSYSVSGSGTHTFRWTYSKDVSLSYGSDCGWVTDYQWTGSSSYTVTFNSNGGMVSETSRSVQKDTVVGQLPVATRNGYTFNGWWTASSGGTQITPTTVVTANATYYAHWISASFTLGGDANWSQQTDGSWRSGVITDSQSTWMETTVSGEVAVSFQWKVSSEATFDKLSFYVDGQLEEFISGTADWRQKYVIVTGIGTHTLRWTYSKDGSVSRGEDCAWIKDYQWGVDTGPEWTIVNGVLVGVELRGHTSVTIPSTVTSIGSNMFENCSGLVSVTIPDSVKDIGERAFFQCGLTSVIIPNSVTNIGGLAFQWCQSLTNVVIGSGVKQIGRQGFYDCDYLERIEFKGNAPICGAYAFYGEGFWVDGGTVVYVPRESTGWGVDIPGTWRDLKIQYSDSVTPSTLPDLYPYTPTGWSGPLVLSSSSQNATTSVATSFSPNDLIYVSLAVTNSGAAFANDFNWALYVDESLRETGANWGQGLSSNGSSRWTAISIGPLSVGAHTIKVVYDYTGLVTESNESNNIVTKSVMVSGTVSHPSNDDFENATVISGVSGSALGSNINATYQSGEPLTAVGASATNTIWWAWTAPASGSVQFNTVGSEVYDTVMGIYTGTSVSTLTKVAANDNCWESGSYYQSSNSFTVVSGTRYYIAASGGNYCYQGGIQLNWSMPNMPSPAYTVTFGKNGGTGGDDYVTATYGKPMPTPRTAPTLAGWTFGGYWDTLALDEKGNPKGKQYYDASMKSVRNWDKKSTATLWAKWTNKVTFGKNGGTGGDNYVTCTKGQPMPKRSMPTKSGYVFDGYWTTTGAGGVKYYNADGTSAHVWDRGGNVTLWAKWVVPVACKVTLGKNGGTGGDNYVTATTGKAMPTPRTAPKRAGWTFGGYWDTLACDAKGNPLGKQYYDASMKSVRAWDKTSAMTLWAKWTVRVKLGKNGGTGGDDYVTVIFNQPFPTRTMPTKSGYAFGGYFVSASAKTGQCYNADGTGTSSMKWTTGGTPTIWALWTKTLACVELPPAVARRAATVAVAAPETASQFAIPAGIYSGVLADGTGAFWLVLDEAEKDAPRTAFLYVARRTHADDRGWRGLCLRSSSVYARRHLVLV